MKQLKNITNILSNKTEDRRYLEYAKVINGYIYATNTWIAIKFKAANYMTEEQAKHLEGKLLHRSLLLDIGKAKEVEINSLGFILDGEQTEFSKEDINFPDIESVLGLEVEEFDYSMATMDVKQLLMLTKCFRKHDNKFSFKFIKSRNQEYPTRPIQVRSISNKELYDEVGIIMPIMMKDS